MGTMYDDDDDDDDRPVGRVLTRREALALMGTASAGALLVACVPSLVTSPGSSASAAPSASGVAGLPSCVVRPELTEGPYFVDEGLDRSDIRSDPSTGEVRPGTLLALAFAVSRVTADACEPFEGALVDVWHCDAAGAYSDVEDPFAGSTVGQKWLRGSQLTDATGMARFTTIYPGWYSGRAVHIHFKIRTDADADAGLEFTSQLFFDESMTAEVYASEPYAANGLADTPNDQDGIYQQGGDQLLLTPVAEGDGYSAMLDIGVDVS
jgi:protocatechuate 3,4-dioxygenase beta subunit